MSICRIVVLGGCAWFASLCGAANAVAVSQDQALQLIKGLDCKDQLTVEQALENSVKSHSQRDLGWRAFAESGYVDVERAILVSKSMELRYRWRVLESGQIAEKNDRAEKLCLKE